MCSNIWAKLAEIEPIETHDYILKYGSPLGQIYPVLAISSSSGSVQQMEDEKKTQQKSSKNAKL